jgi:hypothetical protein
MIIRDRIDKTLKVKEIQPQVRTEILHIPITLSSSEAELVKIPFNNRYYNEPTIIKGNSSVSYTTDDGETYKVGLLMTVKEYLMDKDSQLIIGASVFVRARELPKKLKYPIYGQLDVVVMGQATTKYLGSLETAIPYIPQDGTLTDDSKEFENDPPASITNLTITSGAYIPKSNGRSQQPLAYIKASWDPVIHNDLQGYESDISEDDNQHYDGKPDPKFNSANYMVWTGLELGKTYYIRVRAVDLAGNTSEWVEASGVTPSSTDIIINPPTTLEISEQPPRGIVLNWVASTTPTVVGYEINRAAVNHGDPAPDFSASSKIGETLTTFYIDNYLDVSKDYYYWVRAYTSDGKYSSWTESAGQQPHLITDLTVEEGSLYNALASIDESKLSDNAVSARVIQAGAVTANKIATGALLTYNATIVNRLAGNNIQATVYPNATDGNQYVYFSSGVAYLRSYQNGAWTTINCNINSATVPMSNNYYYYIYFTPSVDGNGEPIADTYDLSYSTSYPTNLHAVVLFYAYSYYSSALGKFTADVQKLGATGTIINGDHIQTGSITAEALAAGTITANSACIGSLNASKLTTGSIDTNVINITHLDASDIAETTTRKWAGESGADITSNHTAKDITYLRQSPSGSGFYLDGVQLGFYDGSQWRTYINNNGYFIMRNSSNHLVLQSGYFQDSAIYSQNNAVEQFNVYDGNGHCTFHASGQEVSIYPQSDLGSFLMLYGKTSNSSSQAYVGLSVSQHYLIGGTVYGLSFTGVTVSENYNFNAYLFDHPVYRQIDSGDYLPFIASSNVVTSDILEHGSASIDNGSYSTTVSFPVGFSSVPDIVVTGFGSGESNVFHVGEVIQDSNSGLYTQFTVGTTDTNGHQFKWIAVGARN